MVAPPPPATISALAGTVIPDEEAAVTELSPVIRPLASIERTGISVLLPTFDCAVVIACSVGFGYEPVKSPPADAVADSAPISLAVGKICW
jgi:hypothetical protein